MSTLTTTGCRMSGAPSESLTVTADAVELAGPSGKLQHEAAGAGGVGLKVSVPTWLPLAPQSVASRVKVSAPGSLVVKL